MKSSSVVLMGVLLAACTTVWGQDGLSGISMEQKVERLPISGMMRITENDGSVKYLSDDKRFVFVGQMYDLWKGESMTAGVEVSQKINWDRNGVSIEKIGFPVGDAYGNQTLFIAPECEDCKALLKLALETRSRELNVVLLASSEAGHTANGYVWCSKDRGKGLRRVYLENSVPEVKDVNQSCDRFGLMLAGQAAQLFGIGQLPMFVDENGNGFTGEQAIYALSQ